MTSVQFNSERFDNDGMHDTVTLNTRITINTAGCYTVGFCGSLAAGTDYVRVYAQLVLNGSTVIVRGPQVETTTNVQPQFAANTVHEFDAGDYIEAQVFHDNTAATARLLDQADDRSPEFYAARIGS